jgi:hypothetical protein
MRRNATCSNRFPLDAGVRRAGRAAPGSGGLRRGQAWYSVFRLICPAGQNHPACYPRPDIAVEEGFAGADVLDKQTTVAKGGSRSGRLDKSKPVACGVRRKAGRGIATGGFRRQANLGQGNCARRFLGQANLGQGNVRHENPGRDAGIRACRSSGPPFRGLCRVAAGDGHRGFQPTGCNRRRPPQSRSDG